MAERSAADQLERFDYPECAGARYVPSWDGWEHAPDVAPAHGGGASSASRNATDSERRLEEEVQRAFESGRARGVEEGRKAQRQDDAAVIQSAETQRIRTAAEMVEQFARQRERYFQSVEQEVVKLALAVAARILRRESQTDPLLLLGAVRVALGQVAASTEVRLRVPAAECELWSEAVALLPNLGAKPVVIGDEHLRLGECTLESSLGRADLGIPAQLGEIAKSFAEGKNADSAVEISAHDEAVEVVA